MPAPHALPHPVLRGGREWSAERQLAAVTSLVADLTAARCDPELIGRGLRYASHLQRAVTEPTVDVDALAVATWVATAQDVLGGARPLVELPQAATPTLSKAPTAEPESGAATQPLLERTLPEPVHRALGTASVSVVAAAGVAVVASLLVGEAALAMLLRVAAVVAWAAWSITLMVWALVTSQVRSAVLWWVAAPVSAPWLAWRFGDLRSQQRER